MITTNEIKTLQADLQLVTDALGALIDDDRVPGAALIRALDGIPCLDKIMGVDENDDMFWALVDMGLVEPMSLEDRLANEADLARDEKEKEF